MSFRGTIYDTNWHQLTFHKIHPRICTAKNSMTLTILHHTLQCKLKWIGRWLLKIFCKKEGVTKNAFGKHNVVVDYGRSSNKKLSCFYSAAFQVKNNLFLRLSFDFFATSTTASSTWLLSRPVGKKCLLLYKISRCNFSSAKNYFWKLTKYLWCRLPMGLAICQCKVFAAK